MTNQNGDIRIAVKSLWKIFGPRGAGIMDEEWAKGASKKEIQERSGHVIAIQDVSLEVRTGEVFVIMGLSGSGKSTLARCLIRLVEPTLGTVEIDGEDITQYTGEQLTQLRRSKTGMIFQHYGLLPHKKVVDNVAYGLEVQGIAKKPPTRGPRRSSIRLASKVGKTPTPTSSAAACSSESASPAPSRSSPQS